MCNTVVMTRTNADRTEMAERILDVAADMADQAQEVGDAAADFLDLDHTEVSDDAWLVLAEETLELLTYADELRKLT